MQILIKDNERLKKCIQYYIEPKPTTQMDDKHTFEINNHFIDNDNNIDDFVIPGFEDMLFNDTIDTIIDDTNDSMLYEHSNDMEMQDNNNTPPSVTYTIPDEDETHQTYETQHIQI